MLSDFLFNNFKNMNKTAQQGVHFESENEYYHSSVTDFDPMTGKVDTAWYEYDQTVNPPVTNLETATDVPLVQFGSYPCGFDLNFAWGRGGIYIPEKDPNTWTIGIFVSKDEINNTVTLAIYNENDPENPSIVTAPFITPPEQFPFFLPNPMFGLRDDIADWMANN